jgi:hypothetical protein
MSRDWLGTLSTLFLTFCIVIIRCTETFWSPCIRKLHLWRSFSTTNYRTRNFWNDPCTLLNKKSPEIRYAITYQHCHNIDLYNPVNTCKLHGCHRIRSNSPPSHCKGTLYTHQGRLKNDRWSPGSSPQNTAEMWHINLLAASHQR